MIATKPETVRPIRTDYGPLQARFYAGPTRAPGAGYQRHEFGKPLDDGRVGARVTTPEDQPVKVNGIPYEVDASYDLISGTTWRADRGGWPAIRRADRQVWEDRTPTPGAREAFYRVIEPAILAALDDPTAIDEARVAAAKELAEDVAAQAAALRAEADRLEAMMASIA